jgi:anti-anti-sigma factor
MRSQTPFSIEESRTRTTTRLILRGELDLSTIDLLRQRLCELRQDGAEVQVDLSELEFMDASGVNILVQAIRDTRRHPWRLSLAPEVSPQVERLFSIVEMDRLVA